MVIKYDHVPREDADTRQANMRFRAAAAASVNKAVEAVNEYGICVICQEPIEYGQEINEVHGKGIIRSGHYLHHNNCFSKTCEYTDKCPICKKHMDCSESNKPLIATSEAGKKLIGGIPAQKQSFLKKTKGFSAWETKVSLGGNKYKKNKTNKINKKYTVKNKRRNKVILY